MSLEHGRIEAIFHEALALTDLAERVAYLDAECGANADLRQRVERLLAAHANRGGFLGGSQAPGDGTISLAEQEPEPDSDEGPPETGTLIAGRYKLLEPIGEGGMGTVHMAEQIEPVRRLVALKLIKPGMDSKAVLARFDAERQALALMDHPNIARVFDAGATSDGRPFFVMELVKGTPITRFCDEQRLTPRQRLELFVPVCQAIQHAHQKGVIHRDIKPSNVLVALYDGHPVVKVIDFGIAKAAGGFLTEQTLHTGFGAIVGTPEYMSPEQATFNQLDVDTRSDVYSLGVLLYELLTGSTPVDRARLGKAAILEVLRVVREEDAQRPSMKLSSAEARASIAANRGTEPAKLSRLLRGELDWIVLKALEKDRNRRYETAAGLAKDVQRYLADEMVEARPPSLGYRARRYVKRNTAALLVLGIGFSLLTGWLVTARSSMNQLEASLSRESTARESAETQQLAAERQRKLAEEREAEAQAAKNEAREALGVARVNEGKAVEARNQEAAARGKEEEARRQAEHDRHAKEHQFVRADGLRLAAEADAARTRDPGLALLLAAEAVKRTPDHLTFNTLYAALADCRELRSFASNAEDDEVNRGWHIYEGDAVQAVYLPGGKRILSAAGASLRVWDVATGQSVGEWRGYNLPITGFAVSPDGKRAAVRTRGYAPVRHDDGTTFNYTDRVIYVVDLEKGIDVLRLRGSIYSLASVEFSPDGSRILTASFDGKARIHDAETGKLSLEIPVVEQALLAARFSPDGSSILTVTANEIKASGMYDSPVWAPEGEKKKLPTDPEYHGGARPLGPNASMLAGGRGYGATGYVATLWDTNTGKKTTACFKLPPSLLTFGHVWYPKAMDLSKDGSRVVVAFPEEVTLWDTATGIPLKTFKGHDGEVNSVAFHPDGKTLATAGADSTVRLWDTANGREVLRLRGHEKPVSGVRFSPSGTKLLTWSHDATARIWDAASGAELAVLRGHTGAIVSAEFCDDERQVVTAGDTSVRVWSLEPPRMPDLTLQGHAGKVTAIAYSPDGKSFLTASVDQSARLWDTRTGQVIREFGGGRPLGEVRSARFSPDGAKVVTAAANRSAQAGEKSVGSAVIVWDVATGKELLALDDLPTGALQAEFSPDGSRILTVGDGALRVQYHTQDPKASKPITIGGFSFNYSSSKSTESGTQILWDAATGKIVARLFEGIGGGYSREEPFDVSFSPDGQRMLTVNPATREATLYRTADGKIVRTFAPPTTSRYGATSASLSPDGRTVFLRTWSLLALFDAETGNKFAQFSEFPGGITTFTLARDGGRLAIAAGKAVFVFAMPGRTLLSTLAGHQETVTTVQFSPDGSRVLTGSRDNSAAVWDTQSGKLLTVCKGHSGKLNDVQFRVDAQQAATLSEDGTAKLWPVDLWPAIAARTPRALTGEEVRRYAVPQPGKKEAPPQLPVVKPPPGTPLPEPFALPSDATPPETIAARQAELAALQARPKTTPEDVQAVRVAVLEFLRLHPASPESLEAATLLATLRSPLDSLDREAIPPHERTSSLTGDTVALLGESRQRVNSGFNTVALSPSERVVVTETYESDWQLQLWDAETLDRKGTIPGAFFGFAPDREVLYTYRQNAVHEWDVSGPEPREVRVVKLPAAGNVLAVSRDGRWAAGYGKSFDDFWVWDMTSPTLAGRRLHRATAKSNEYNGAVFSPAGDRLVMQVGKKLFLHDLRKPEQAAFEFEPKGLVGVRASGSFYVFSPDGSRLSIWLDEGEEDGIELWDLTTSPPLRQCRIACTGVATQGFSDDGRSLVVHYSDRDGVVYDVSVMPPVEKASIPAPIGRARYYARSRAGDRTYLASSVAIRRFDRSGNDWRESRPLVGHASAVVSLAFADDGRTLYSTDYREIIKEWRLDGNHFTERRSAEQFGYRVVVKPDEKRLIGGYYGFTLWDTASLKRRTPSLDRQVGGPVPMVLTPDGRCLFRAGWKPNLTIHDLSGPEPRLDLKIEDIGEDHIPGSLAITPDGSLLAIALQNRQEPDPVLLYRRAGDRLQPLAFPPLPATAVLMSPSGKLLAVTDGKTVSLVDLTAAPPTVRTRIDLSGEAGGEPEMLFTPDGRQLVIVYRRVATIWDASTGAKLGESPLPRSPGAVALAPDGRHLAAGFSNGTIQVERLRKSR